MPAYRESGRVEPGLPAVSGADGGGVVEEAVFFFLLGQLGEFGVEWVIGFEERLFAVEDRRVGAGRGLTCTISRSRCRAFNWSTRGPHANGTSPDSGPRSIWPTNRMRIRCSSAIQSLPVMGTVTRWGTTRRNRLMTALGPGLRKRSTMSPA